VYVSVHHVNTVAFAEASPCGGEHCNWHIRRVPSD